MFSEMATNLKKISSSVSNMFNEYTRLPRSVYILFISRIINSIGTFVYPLLALIMTQKIGMSKAEAGMFTTFLALSQAPSIIVGGKLTDMIGRKKIIMIFQSLGALSFLFCGFIKPTMTMAYVIALASNFYALSSPALDAIVADMTTPENRKSTYSLLYMGHNLGFAAGPIIGGLLYKSYLPVIFIGDALTTLISICLIVLFIGETYARRSNNRINENHRSQAEVESVFEESSEVAYEETAEETSEVTTEITSKETLDGTSKLEEDLSEKSLTHLERHEKGSVFRVLLKRPILIYFAAIMFIYQFSYSQWGFALPLQMNDVFGDKGASYYGFVAGFNGIVVIVCTPFITAFMRKTSLLKSIAFGGVLYAIAFGMFGVISNLFLFFAAITVMTWGEIMISTNHSTFVANHTPASHRGRVNSILPLIMGAGYSLGPMVTGKVNTLYGNFTTWLFISGFVFCGAMGMLLLERLDRKGDKFPLNSQ